MIKILKILIAPAQTRERFPVPRLGTDGTFPCPAVPVSGLTETGCRACDESRGGSSQSFTAFRTLEHTGCVRGGLSGCLANLGPAMEDLEKRDPKTRCGNEVERHMGLVG